MITTEKAAQEKPKDESRFASISAFVWNSVKPYKWYYIVLLQSPLMNSSNIFISGYSMKMVVDAFSKEVISYHEIGIAALIFVSYAIIRQISWRLAHFAWLKTQPFIKANLAADAYNRIQSYPYEFFQNTQSGTIISKLKGVVDGYEKFWTGVHHRLANPILQLCIAIFALSIINVYLFLFMIIWVLIFFPVMLKLTFKLSKFAKNKTEWQHRAFGLMADNISNIFTLFSFAKKEEEAEKITNFLTQKVAQEDYKYIGYNLKTSIVSGIFYTIMSISLFVMTTYLRERNLITTGDLVFVVTLALWTVDSVFRLVSEIITFIGEMGDFKSSFSILQQDDYINTDNAMPNKLEVTKGEIEFKNMSFSYSGNSFSTPIFDKFNLKIKHGTRVGIVGYSGSGKSTLISLLTRNFNVCDGEILIDGQNISLVNANSVRSQIALIPQDTSMFHRSIKDNINYACPNATDEQTEKAAKIANIHDFILTMPDKYETMVGERGVKLSGGQRQRISIARAILKHAPILILDEATSALDSVTEKGIQESINAVLDNSKATVIVIAHRLSTIKHLDRILLIEKGCVIEDGSFAELINNGGEFKKLWDQQADGML